MYRKSVVIIVQDRVYLKIYYVNRYRVKANQANKTKIKRENIFRLGRTLLSCDFKKKKTMNKKLNRSIGK